MLATKQDELMPKKKFTFTTRKNERDISDGDSLPREDKNNKHIPLLITSALMQCGFSNKQDEKLSMQVRMCIWYILIRAYILWVYICTCIKLCI